MDTSQTAPLESSSGVQSEQSKPNTTAGDNNNSNNNNSINNNKKDSRSNMSKDSGSRGRRGDRSRSRRRSRSPIRGSRGEDRSSKASKRVYVANIPFDVRWGELKDLFREKVGNVRFCQLFENEEGKPRGCGLVELEDSASAQKAVDVLNRYSFKGRELVVKEDLDFERDRYGRLILPSRRDNDRSHHRDRDRHDHYDDHYRDDHYRNGSDSGSASYNTYGLSPQFLSSLGIKGPLNNRAFIANLDYKVSERKLEDIFRLAGKVTRVKLYVDNEGKSKGFGVVEFEHPVEAVQAISMFNNQKLYDRILSVRLDRFDNEELFASESLPSKLPKGLGSIGKGLGIGGQPLNISKSMINNQGPMNAIGGVQQPPVPPPVAPVVSPSNVVAPQAASAAISALTNLAGNLQNLPSLAQSLAQLSNNAALGNTIAQSGYNSSTNDMAPPSVSAPVAPAYNGGYSSVGQQPNGMSQTSQYNPSQIPSGGGYGLPAANVPSSAPYGGGNGGVVGGSVHTGNSVPISSYSTYDQRAGGGDYRDDKYRGPGIDTIFVRNLPPNFSWQNLRDRFNEVGEVRFAEMKGHGTSIVRFATDRDAQRAVDLMNGIRIENRAIEVSLYY